MGGTWVDYNLMTRAGSVVWASQLFPITATNRSARARSCRGWLTGYFVLPYTIGKLLAASKPLKRLWTMLIQEREAAVKAFSNRLLSIKRQAETVTSLIANLGQIAVGKIAAWLAMNRVLKEALKEF